MEETFQVSVQLLSFVSCLFPLEEFPPPSLSATIVSSKRALETRVKEHKAAIRREEMEKSAIAEHACNYHHQMAWDEIKVLDEAANNTTLLIKEALHICLTDKETLLNRDEGVVISDCWASILSHAHSISSSATSSTHQR